MEESWIKKEFKELGKIFLMYLGVAFLSVPVSIITYPFIEIYSYDTAITMGLIIMLPIAIVWVYYCHKRFKIK